MDLVVAPDFAGAGDVVGLGRVDASQVADAFAVFGVLADGDVNAVLVKNGRRVDLARAFRGRILVFFAFGRIAIAFPGHFQIRGVPFLHRFRVERVAPAVAAAEKDQGLAIFSGLDRDDAEITHAFYLVGHCFWVA